VPKWDHLIRLRTGFGYDDNVALASTDEEASTFFYTGLEAAFSRLAEAGPQLDFLITADDIRFFSDKVVDKEQVALVQAQLDQRWTPSWRSTLALEYFYQDQVLDVSITETNLARVQVLGHTFIARPGVRWDGAAGWWLALELQGERELLRAPLDNYWEVGPVWVAGRTYGHRSELSLGYEFSYRFYDEDEQLDEDGNPIAGTDRALRQHEARLTWRHYWDARRSWRTTAKLTYALNQDNGSGYFDFHKAQGSFQLRYGLPALEVLGEAKLAYYYFPVQTVSDVDDSNRQRVEAILSLRSELALTRFVKLFAEYEFEQVESNLSLEEYTVNTVRGGLIWEF
jgi:hypothetical protein